jgi:pimeloyl-ACP methyl ester carboxylesterase
MADSHPAQAAWAAFDQAYQVLIDAWPAPVTSHLVPTDYGETHVLMSGDESGPVIALMPGGGATAGAWSAVAGGLSSHYCVIAVDPIGQPGRSTLGERRLGDVAAVNDWLGQLLAALAVDRLTLAGHSYGAWTALRFGMHAPDRVERLVLVDPTDCFSTMRLSYRLRAAPLFVRPSGARLRRFLDWETQGRTLSPAWLNVAALGADLGRLGIVTPRVPRPDDLARLAVPTLVVAAGRSQANDPRQMLRRAAERLTHGSDAVLPLATHHTLPTEDAHELVPVIERFLVPS